MKQEKKIYVCPSCEVVKIEVSHMLASSITGSAPDSDDSEFGARANANVRREEWGDLC